MKTRPLGNNVLIEVLRKGSSVSTTGEEQTKNYGILRDASFSGYHLTASASEHFSTEFIDNMKKSLKSMIGKVVRWEEFAEAGQTFTEDGKEYALIPWWRLIGYEEK